MIDATSNPKACTKNVRVHLTYLPLGTQEKLSNFDGLSARPFTYICETRLLDSCFRQPKACGLVLPKSLVANSEIC
jgi:hypothetical protein